MYYCRLCNTIYDQVTNRNVGGMIGKCPKAHSAERIVGFIPATIVGLIMTFLGFYGWGSVTRQIGMGAAVAKTISFAVILLFIAIATWSIVQGVNAKNGGHPKSTQAPSAVGYGIGILMAAVVLFALTAR